MTADLPGVLVCCSVPSNGALSSCDVTTVTALVAAADDDEENEADGEEDDEDEDDDGDGGGDEKEERREEETADSRGSAADIASVTAAAATTTTIRIDHDQLYRLRVFHILPTNAQVGGGVVTHATVGQQQLIGRPIASTAVIASASYIGTRRHGKTATEVQ